MCTCAHVVHMCHIDLTIFLAHHQNRSAMQVIGPCYMDPNKVPWHWQASIGFISWLHFTLLCCIPHFDWLHPQCWLRDSSPICLLILASFCFFCHTFHSLPWLYMALFDPELLPSPWWTNDLTHPSSEASAAGLHSDCSCGHSLRLSLWRSLLLYWWDEFRQSGDDWLHVWRRSHRLWFVWEALRNP